MLGDFGLTWPRLACLGLAWPWMALFRALACPAVGLQTLRLYSPCQHFRGVRLTRPRLEKGSDKGRQGRLWPRLWHPLVPSSPAFGANLAAKTASKRRQKFNTKIENENDQDLDHGGSKTGSIFEPEKRIGSYRSLSFSGWWPQAAPGLPKGCPRSPHAAVWAPFSGLIGLPRDRFESLLVAFGEPWHPLASVMPPLALLALPQGNREATKENFT